MRMLLRRRFLGCARDRATPAGGVSLDAPVVSAECFLKRKVSALTSCYDTVEIWLLKCR